VASGHSGSGGGSTSTQGSAAPLLAMAPLSNAPLTLLPSPVLGESRPLGAPLPVTGLLGLAVAPLAGAAPAPAAMGPPENGVTPEASDLAG
jgi:hypothetical protein